MTIAPDPHDPYPLGAVTEDDIDRWAEQGHDPGAPEVVYEPNPQVVDGELGAAPVWDGPTALLPATPPTTQPKSGLRPSVGSRAGTAVLAAARRAAGRVGPASWWVIERVWRHPLMWAAAAAGALTLTSVSVGQLLILAALLAVTAALSPGKGRSRRERLLSVVQWTTFRGRRRRLRRRWVKLWTNAGLARTALTPGSGKRLPTLKRVRRHRYGITAIIDGSDVAVGVIQVVGAADALVTTLGARSIRVQVHERQGVLAHLPATGNQSRLAIDFKYDDPFPRTISVTELPAASRPGNVVVGPDEDGGWMEKSLLLPSLIVGAPGSGKSSEGWTTLHQLRMQGMPFRLRVFDPKGGMELGDLESVAFRYESKPSGWADFLAAACGGLQVRQDMARKRGLRKLPLDENWPLDLMLVDELVTVLAMSKGLNARVRAFGQELTAREAFLVYMSQIRSANGSVLAFTQDVRQEVLGPIRGMFPYVSCLRMGPTEAEAVDIVLGRGAHNAFPAHMLAADGSDAGKGWCRTKTGIVKYRAAFMDDSERAHESLEIGRMTQAYRARGQRDPEVEKIVRNPRAPRAQRGNGAGRTKAAAGRTKAPATAAGSDGQ